MSKEYTLSDKEKNDLLNGSSKQPYKMKGHQFKPMNGTGKQVCNSCGLVALRNQATEWCIEKGCNFSDHNQYESTMKRLTKAQW